MAATLGYSSSGLLAPDAPITQLTPRSSSPTTPRATYATLVQDDTTPTAPSITPEAFADESQALPSIAVAAADDSRPRLRRRRSSLAGAASPLANMKTSAPIRHAAASVQRSLRTRSGSDASVMSNASASSVSTFGAAGAAHDSAPAGSKNAAKPTGIAGRLRSGSLGTALRPRRGLRRIIPSAPAPPPNVPLPPLPMFSVSPSLPHAPPPLPVIIASPTTPSTPRRPLVRRVQTFDNYELTSAPFSVAGASLMCAADEEDALAAGGPALALAKGPRDNSLDDMPIDYPSPVDGAPFEWGRQQN